MVSMLTSSILLMSCLLSIDFCRYAYNLKCMLLLESGDIETNPGPRRPFFIKFCHWNLNGLATHDFVEMPLIVSFITTQFFFPSKWLHTFLQTILRNKIMKQFKQDKIIKQ